MFGLDLLVTVANVIYLCSYSVRDILWLRILSVCGILLLLPYYYLQDTPLWTPMGWNVFFALINLYWIKRILSDRRPVPFNDDERRLYRLAMQPFSEREAFTLFRLGTWSTVPAETTIFTQGEAVDTLMLIVDGQVDVEMDGKDVDTLGEGRFLGGIAFLNRDTKFTTPVTVRATETTRIITWSFSDLESQFAKEIEL
ncbi:MAG: cyclic nucleotide-binding domain-containing protein, partial [Pseudomonadota bacterium]